MKKKLRFIISLLFMLVCSVVAKATEGDVYKLVTSASSLKDGDVVVIASKGSDVAMGKINSSRDGITGVGVTSINNMISWKDGLGEVTLEKTGSNWYLKFGGYYIYSPEKGNIYGTQNELGFSTSLSSSDNRKYSISVESNGTAEIKNIYRNRYTCLGYNGGFKFCDSYKSTSNLKIYRKLAANGISIFGTSGSFSLNGGSKKFPVTNPNNLTLTYTSSCPWVASIDADGYVTPNTWGKTTITVKFAGDDTYMPYEKTYELVITDNKKNIDYRTVTFEAGTEKGHNENAYKGSDDMTKSNVTISSENATFTTSPYSLRYSTAMDIKVDKGRIVMVEIEGSLNSDMTSPDGKYEKPSSALHVWTGSSKAVIINNASGNSVDISAIRVYVEYPNVVDYTFDESKENTVEAWDNANVTLNRTLVANKWNTLCLPFDVEGDNLVKLLGEGAKVTEYSSTDDEGTLKFTKVDKMVAGKPYLVKPTMDGNKYTFEGIEIKVTEPTVDGDDIKFKGLFSPKDITEDGKTAGVTGTGAIKFATGGSKTKAFRAYFVVPAATSTAALCLSIDGTVTAISDIVADTEDDANAPVYNLQGQRVDARSLTKGVYIKNGRKFVVNK